MSIMEKAASWISRQAQARVPYDADNLFLTGPFAPVDREITETRLLVTGEIPRELNGLYARIGPNPIKVENPANHHWFLGDGMVHGVRLNDGQALWYRNRYIGTDKVNAQLGRPAAPGLRHRPDVNSTVNTNLIGQAGKLWALVEAGSLPVQLGDTLETERHGYFNAPVQRAFAAHPHRDPRTGDLHAICYDVMVQTHVYYVVISPDGQIANDVAIPVRHGPMIHDCALTQSKILVLDLPITFSMSAVMQGNRFPYQWNDKHPARIGLMPLHGKAEDIAWVDIDPLFAFHTANAFDNPDGTVTLDLITYAKMFDGSRQGPERGQTSRFERLVLDSANNRASRKLFSEFPQEFPRCDERLTGQPYAYAYSVGIDLDRVGPEPMYRYDMRTGAIERHDFGPTHMPAEAVFVPRHVDAAEDDGYLLTYVYDLATNTSTLSILHAAGLSGEPAAVIQMPQRVPLGFHGNWIPDHQAGC
jgi:carotenoid cleavage dioxygenase